MPGLSKEKGNGEDAADHPVLASFVSLNAGQQILQLVQQEASDKQDEMGQYEDVETLRKNGETIVNATDLLSRENVQLYILNFQKCDKLVAECSSKLRSALERVMMVYQSIYGRFAKHHISTDLLPWLTLQVDMLRSKNMMSAIPSWPMLNTKVLEGMLGHLTDLATVSRSLSLEYDV